MTGFRTRYNCYKCRQPISQEAVDNAKVGEAWRCWAGAIRVPLTITCNCGSTIRTNARGTQRELEKKYGYLVPEKRGGN